MRLGTDSIVGIVLLVLAVIIFRNAARLRERRLARPMRRCDSYPLPMLPAGRDGRIRCALRTGHRPPCLVDPGDVIKAGYHPTPF